MWWFKLFKDGLNFLMNPNINFSVPVNGEHSDFPCPR